MDLTSINDIKSLKALAYDQLVAKETASHNLQLINQRLTQLDVPEQTENLDDQA